MTAAVGERTVRYLLGELPEAERDVLEEEYFTSETAFDELKAAEEDLIDAYCRGTLAPHRRGAFEARYLETESGRQRLQFARTLAAVAARRPARTAWSGWGAWAAVLAMMALGAGLFASRAQLLRERSAALADQQERLRAEAAREQRLAELAAERDGLRVEVGRLERALATAGLARVASLVLGAGLQRDAAAAPRLVLEPDTEIARLTLRLKTAPHSSYDVIVQSVDGVPLWRRHDVRTQVTGGPALVVFVPAAALRDQHAVVVVRGRDQPPAEAHAEFSFEVRRRAP